jgi:broad specificity phosphatase PhoE
MVGNEERAMSIVLIRHGETELNAARVLQPAATPLSGRGKLQALALAHRLARLGAGAILSSDLPRALQTAQAIAAATGLGVHESALLHERDFGDLRGRSYDELGFDAIAMQQAPPAGESMADFRGRVGRAMVLLLERRKQTNGNLIVVTHGLVIRCLLERHVALPAGMASPERIANASVTVFAAQPPHQADIVNCTVHLDANLSGDARALSGV